MDGSSASVWHLSGIDPKDLICYPVMKKQYEFSIVFFDVRYGIWKEKLEVS